MRIAFVHEYLNQFGGAERMLASLCELFPRAPIYTLLYDERSTKGLFKDRTIRTSFLQHMPFAKAKHTWYPLLMPLAIEQFDFSNFDLVVSVSASFAKGVVTKPGTRHICYCLTPPRFLWDSSQKFVEDFGFPAPIKKMILPFISYLRIWDHHASRRVDEFWTISEFIGSRIQKYYNRSSVLIYPPVEVSKFSTSSELGNYFLMVGRLVSYKKFDVAIEAFNRLGLPLKIAGVGPEQKRLQKMAERNIEFLGNVNDDQLASLYSRARALVFPQEEDFGIVPLEAMASGRPVIAYRSGGTLETVIEGETGMFFDDQSPETLAATVLDFNHEFFDPNACRSQAEKFDVSVFKENILKTLKQ